MIPHERVEHAQRKGVLRPSYLVVVQLHRIDGAAAELIVLRIGSKYRTEQNVGTRALGLNRS